MGFGVAVALLLVATIIHVVLLQASCGCWANAPGTCPAVSTGCHASRSPSRDRLDTELAIEPGPRSATICLVSLPGLPA